MAIRCGNCFQILSEKTVCPTCGYDNTLEKKEANSLDQGTVLLDRYVIGRVLGVGGFGITYLAYDMVEWGMMLHSGNAYCRPNTFYHL